MKDQNVNVQLIISQTKTPMEKQFSLVKNQDFCFCTNISK